MIKLKSWKSNPSRKKTETQKIAFSIQKGGLPYKFFVGLKMLLSINESLLGEILFIKLTTLGRRKKEGHFNIEESDRIARLTRILEFAVTVLKDEQTAVRWFKSPQKALGNRVPLEISKTDSGCREVEDLLGRIEHGIFS